MGNDSDLPASTSLDIDNIGPGGAIIPTGALPAQIAEKEEIASVSFSQRHAGEEILRSRSCFAWNAAPLRRSFRMTEKEDEIGILRACFPFASCFAGLAASARDRLSSAIGGILAMTCGRGLYGTTKVAITKGRMLQI